ncbi:PREDICTED: phosphatidylinositol N-acetylglucosaminyltransferase subunit C-like isoform X2 [Priapulus caudatus]|uniref:Phosphatidylinositol N-acetylglucosaminyltransferase subunit C-like isoform X2 n=1 Tax=Priapulus caudatus TaxID=37621 RepID=A0ABM1E997_PRICU|nr:PREDICTED: phosphatidylinositol N-acetylglucosaminyltransferase subunit C-like isoform X2 [Priapulus caudatus]
MPPNQLKWKRVLYEKQDVPDNYVDETFLDELRKNVNTTTYSFWPTVLESGVVTQQLSSVIIFVDSFVLMQEGEVSPHTLFAVSALLTLIAYVIYKSTASAGTVSISEQDGGNEESCIVDDIKAAITFLALAYGLAPILATLTESISTDTIYAMSTAMLLANLVLYDYGPSAAIVSGTVSFNAAMFASVCLASRLPTLWHTFATVTLSAEMFAMLPIFRKRLKFADAGMLRITCSGDDDVSSWSRGTGRVVAHLSTLRCSLSHTAHVHHVRMSTVASSDSTFQR